MNTAHMHAFTSADNDITVRIPRRGQGHAAESPRVVVHPRFDPRCSPTMPRIRRERAFTQTLPSAGVFVQTHAVPATSRGIELRWVVAFVFSVLIIASTMLVATVMQLFV